MQTILDHVQQDGRGRARRPSHAGGGFRRRAPAGGEVCASCDGAFVLSEDKKTCGCPVVENAESYDFECKVATCEAGFKPNSTKTACLRTLGQACSIAEDVPPGLDYSEDCSGGEMCYETTTYQANGGGKCEEFFDSFETPVPSRTCRWIYYPNRPQDNPPCEADSDCQYCKCNEKTQTKPRMCYYPFAS